MDIKKYGKMNTKNYPKIRKNASKLKNNTKS